MIIDKLENHTLYQNIHKDFKKVFDFISNTNLLDLNLGKHTIDKNTVFAIVSEYDTKAEKNCLTETHKKYIDIQYIVKGEEYIAVKTLQNEIATTPYNKETDAMFYTLKNLSKIKLSEKHFAIFFPDDIHQPTIQVDTPKKVKKIVFKILK